MLKIPKIESLKLTVSILKMEQFGFTKLIEWQTM